MNKRFYTLFTALFLLLCALPALGLCLLGPSEAGANEVPAPRPAPRTKRGWNPDYLSELSAYVASRFAGRRELITANAALTAALLGESASDSVVLGADGWLFYAGTLDDYTGASAMTDRELRRAARMLALVQEAAGARGARFCFTVAPNKNSLYPELMPSRYPRGAERSNWDRLRPLLEEQGVSFCDLFPVLAASKTPVYYKTDSHWDGLGSALAAGALASALGGKSTLASEEFTLAAHRGDLYEMLYPAGTGSERGRVLARERRFSYKSKFRAPDDQWIETESGGELGALLMFRDSFGNALHEDLAELFSTAAFSRAGAPRFDLLDGQDVLLWELVERNLPKLLENAPVFPAPTRSLQVPAEAGAAVRLEKSECAELPGLLRYRGSVETDPDSPVLISLDGTLYEATPVGTDGFTLYAPDAEKAAVFVRAGGRWLRGEGLF